MEKKQARPSMMTGPYLPKNLASRQNSQPHYAAHEPKNQHCTMVRATSTGSSMRALQKK